MNTDTGLNSHDYATHNSATASTAGTANTTAGERAGQALGDKVKGGWNVFHGAGESLRGNVNAFVDNVGEQIAGRGDGDERGHVQQQQPTATATGRGERPADTAARGENEVGRGIDRLFKDK